MKRVVTLATLMTTLAVPAFAQAENVSLTVRWQDDQGGFSMTHLTADQCRNLADTLIATFTKGTRGTAHCDSPRVTETRQFTNQTDDNRLWFTLSK